MVTAAPGTESGLNKYLASHKLKYNDSYCPQTHLSTVWWVRGGRTGGLEGPIYSPRLMLMPEVTIWSL